MEDLQLEELTLRQAEDLRAGDIVVFTPENVSEDYRVPGLKKGEIYFVDSTFVDKYVTTKVRNGMRHIYFSPYSPINNIAIRVSDFGRVVSAHYRAFSKPIDLVEENRNVEGERVFN